MSLNLRTLNEEVAKRLGIPIPKIVNEDIKPTNLNIPLTEESMIEENEEFKTQELERKKKELEGFEKHAIELKNEELRRTEEYKKKLEEDRIKNEELMKKMEEDRKRILEENRKKMEEDERNRILEENRKKMEEHKRKSEESKRNYEEIKEREKEHKENIKQISNGINILNEEKEKCLEEKKALEDKIKELQNRISELEPHSIELESIKKIVDDKNIEITNLQNEKKILEDKIANFQILGQRYKDLEQKLLTNTVENMNGINELNDEIKNLNTEIENLTGKNKSLEEQIQILKNQSPTIELKNKISNLEKTLEEFKRENNDLIQQINNTDKEDEIKILREQLAEKERDFLTIQNLKDKIPSDNTEMMKLLEELKQLMNERNQFIENPKIDEILAKLNSQTIDKNFEELKLQIQNLPTPEDFRQLTEYFENYNKILNDFSGLKFDELKKTLEEKMDNFYTLFVKEFETKMFKEDFPDLNAQAELQDLKDLIMEEFKNQHENLKNPDFLNEINAMMDGKIKDIKDYLQNSQIQNSEKIINDYKNIIDQKLQPLADKINKMTDPKDYTAEFKDLEQKIIDEIQIVEKNCKGDCSELTLKLDNLILRFEPIILDLQNKLTNFIDQEDKRWDIETDRYDSIEKKLEELTKIVKGLGPRKSAIPADLPKTIVDSATFDYYEDRYNFKNNKLKEIKKYILELMPLVPGKKYYNENTIQRINDDITAINILKDLRSSLPQPKRHQIQTVPRWYKLLILEEQGIIGEELAKISSTMNDEELNRRGKGSLYK